jgi:tetratricopeptide (TPR) repeat protein
MNRWIAYGCGLALSFLATSAECAPEPPQSSAQLVKQGMAYERAGQKAKAAETYEELIRIDPTKRMVLSRRLVNLYAETGKTNAALNWAEQITENHPDPQAYLAGVHTMLGNYKEAEQILEKEVAAAKEDRQKLSLRWQLAHVYEKEGKPDKSEKLLKEASELSKGKPEHKTASERLYQFHRKHRKKTEKDSEPSSRK